MWFDSHCHLFDCEGSAKDVADRARAAEVDDMLVAGTDVATSRTALELAQRDGVHAAVGVHPNSSAGWSDELLSEVEELLGGAVAVGESGLDFYRDHSPPEAQRRAFGAHIELAKEHDKALIIHTRDSIDAVIDALEQQGAPERLVFHCWSSDAARMEAALGLGAYVSFAGNVSFKNAVSLREVVPLVPDDRLLVETDSPYLAPVPRRGRPNEPAFVRYVGEAVAVARGGSVEDIARITARNARRLFALDG